SWPSPDSSWPHDAQKRASTRSTVSLQLGQRITGAGRTPRIRRTAPAPPSGRSLLGGGGLVPAAGGGVALAGLLRLRGREEHRALVELEHRRGDRRHRR